MSLISCFGQWHQREFKVGEDKEPRRVGCGEGWERGAPSQKILLYCDLEMAYFSKFRGAKFKVCNNIVGDVPIDIPIVAKPKYWRGCVPGIPGGVDTSGFGKVLSAMKVHGNNAIFPLSAVNFCVKVFFV